MRKSCPCIIREAYCQPLCSFNSRRYSEGQSKTGIALVQEDSSFCRNRHKGCECEPGGCTHNRALAGKLRSPVSRGASVHWARPSAIES